MLELWRQNSAPQLWQNLLSEKAVAAKGEVQIKQQQ
jgi:hypothetical protein